MSKTTHFKKIYIITTTKVDAKFPVIRDNIAVRTKRRM